ncbi:MAG TPA: hypothetical protein VHX38_28885 [Pseudonocardiaceae bacterium]|nr:hypothetical protein [Pseudonocardiaceae bacterium]
MIFLVSGAVQHNVAPRLDTNLVLVTAAGSWIVWASLVSRATICAELDRLRLLHAARGTASPPARLRLVPALAGPGAHQLLHAVARAALRPAPAVFFAAVALLVIAGMLAPAPVMPAVHAAQAAAVVVTTTVTTTVTVPPSTTTRAPALASAPARASATTRHATTPAMAPATGAATTPAAPSTRATTTAPAVPTTPTGTASAPVAAPGTPPAPPSCKHRCTREGR